MPLPFRGPWITFIITALSEEQDYIGSIVRALLRCWDMLSRKFSKNGIQDDALFWISAMKYTIILYGQFGINKSQFLFAMCLIRHARRFSFRTEMDQELQYSFLMLNCHQHSNRAKMRITANVSLLHSTIF